MTGWVIKAFEISWNTVGIQQTVFGNNYKSKCFSIRVDFNSFYNPQLRALFEKNPIFRTFDLFLVWLIALVKHSECTLPLAKWSSPHT